MARKEFKGGAAANTLSGSLASGTGTGGTFALSSDPGASWPTGAGGSFVLCIGQGTASEEKILCSSRSGATVTIGTRGYDGTTAITHSSGETVEHTLDANTIDEANDHVNTTGRDDHTQYLNTTRHDTTTRHSVGSVVPAGSAGEIGRLVAAASASAGATTKAADAGHTHQEPVLPFARIRREANLSVPSGTTPTWISFDTEVSDTDGIWSSGTNITISETGLWLVVASIVWAAGSVESMIVLETPSGGWGFGNHRSVGPVTAQRLQVSDLRLLTSGDVLRVGVRQVTGSSHTLGGTGGEDETAAVALCRIGALS